MKKLELNQVLTVGCQINQELSTPECFSKLKGLTHKSDRQRIEILEKQIKKLDLKFEILKNAKWYLSKGRQMIFYFIKCNEKTYSIREMCKVLSVNEGTYRKWRNQIVTETIKSKLTVQKEITCIFFEAKHRYGYPRITIELRKRGYIISKSTVFKYMKQLGLSSKIKKAGINSK